MTRAELLAQADGLEWAAREAKCSNYIDMSRRCFGRASELRAQAEKAADDWQHLKAFGYAPGHYMTECQACKTVCIDLDKRAITCRPCAEKAFAAAQERHIGPGTPSARLEYLLSELARLFPDVRNPLQSAPPELNYIAAIAAAQAENYRLVGKACLLCGAPKPCELAETEYSPCTFDPNPIQAARAFLDRAIKAEADLAALEALCRDLEVRLKDELAEIERAQGIGGRLEVERDEARAEAQALRDVFRGVIQQNISYRWDGEKQCHVPWIMVDFAEVPIGGGCTAQGWRDRDTFAAAIDAARSAMPGSAPTERKT